MTVDEYLHALEGIICRHFDANDPAAGMTSATVGYLAQHALGQRAAEVGFPRFKDALLELQRRGAIRVGENSKGALAVWLLPASNAEVTQSPPARCLPTDPPISRFLKKPVWLAFVSQGGGGRFLSRGTGEVRFNQPAAPEPPASWVAIDPIAESTQRDWALQWLQEYGRETDPELLHALSAPQWFTELPAAMRAKEPSLESSWKRHRSNLVVAHVARWCAVNALDDTLVFQGATDEKRPSAGRMDADASDLRRSLVCAILRMSTVELMRLRIPARHLIAVLRPDLLDG